MSIVSCLLLIWVDGGIRTQHLLSHSQKCSLYTTSTIEVDLYRAHNLKSASPAGKIRTRIFILYRVRFRRPPGYCGKCLRAYRRVGVHRQRKRCAYRLRGVRRRRFVPLPGVEPGSFAPQANVLSDGPEREAPRNGGRLNCSRLLVVCQTEEVVPECTVVTSALHIAAADVEGTETTLDPF